MLKALINSIQSAHVQGETALNEQPEELTQKQKSSGSCEDPVSPLYTGTENTMGPALEDAG